MGHGRRSTAFDLATESTRQLLLRREGGPVYWSTRELLNRRGNYTLPTATDFGHEMVESRQTLLVAVLHAAAVDILAHSLQRRTSEQVGGGLRILCPHTLHTLLSKTREGGAVKIVLKSQLMHWHRVYWQQPN